MNHANTKIRIIAGADKDRLKLSSIFHKPINEIVLSLLPKIHGISCQSPLVQRCNREAATSVFEGKSSNKFRSLIKPHLAKIPSNKSWLSREFSGILSLRTASKISKS